MKNVIFFLIFVYILEPPYECKNNALLTSVRTMSFLLYLCFHLPVPYSILRKKGFLGWVFFFVDFGENLKTFQK